MGNTKVNKCYSFNRITNFIFFNFRKLIYPKKIFLKNNDSKKLINIISLE